MRKATSLLILLFVVACSTADSDQPVYPPQRRPPIDREGARVMSGGLDLLPPGDWWHQPTIAEAVKLTGDQMSALDKIASDQSDEIARLDRDMVIAVRDLRTLLGASQPSTGDIVSAGQRLRGLRDALLDRQVRMLAAERQVLSLDQWQALQQQLQERRSQRNQDYGPRRGGRGMGGGRGRWPGF